MSFEGRVVSWQWYTHAPSTNTELGGSHVSGPLGCCADTSRRRCASVFSAGPLLAVGPSPPPIVASFARALLSSRCLVRWLFTVSRRWDFSSGNTPKTDVDATANNNMVVNSSRNMLGLRMYQLQRRRVWGMRTKKKKNHYVCFRLRPHRLLVVVHCTS